MSYNSTYTGQQIDTAVRDGEWYNLQCVSDGVQPVAPERPKFRFTRFVIIENFVPKLCGEEYRLVFMRQKRVSKKGLKWCIPMFGAIHETLSAAPLEETYTPVTGNRVPVDFSSVSWMRTSSENIQHRILIRFIDTGNTRKRVGYALFKKTGLGTFGWQRVSNIIGICASQGNKLIKHGPNFSIFSE